jgi:hypothetical protein
MRERRRWCECGQPLGVGAARCGRCGRTDHAIRTWPQVAALWRERSGEQTSDDAIREAGQAAIRRLRRLLLADPLIQEWLGLPPDYLPPTKPMRRKRPKENRNRC